MPTTIRRIPCPRKSFGKEPLLDFARRASALIEPGFAAPAVVVSETKEELPYDHDETCQRLGTAAKGFEVVLRSDYHEGSAPWTGESVAVKAYGLPGGDSLEIKWDGNQPAREITLQVSGPATAVKKALEAFEREFGGPLSPEQVASLAESALFAARHDDWEKAKEYGEVVLRTTPESAKALFAFGVASGAAGDLDAAQKALSQVVKLDPGSYDAWYNLGNAHRERRAHEEAAVCYRAALDIHPGHHPALYRLASSLEAAGRHEEALAAYRETLRTTPKPRDSLRSYVDFTDRQRCRYSTDFAKQAEQAIARLLREAPRASLPRLPEEACRRLDVKAIIDGAGELAVTLTNGSDWIVTELTIAVDVRSSTGVIPALKNLDFRDPGLDSVPSREGGLGRFGSRTVTTHVAGGVTGCWRVIEIRGYPEGAETPHP